MAYPERFLGGGDISKYPTGGSISQTYPETLYPRISSSYGILFDYFRYNAVGQNRYISFQVNPEVLPQVTSILDTLPKYAGRCKVLELCLVAYTVDQSTITLNFIGDLDLIGSMTYLRKAFADQAVNIVVRRHLKIENPSVQNFKFKFDLIDASALDATKIRNIMLTQIPTMAASCVDIYPHKTRTAFTPANIAQLLWSIVFDSRNVEKYIEYLGCDPNDREIRYYLEINNNSQGFLDVTTRYLKSSTTDVLPVEYDTPDQYGHIIRIPQTIIRLGPYQSVYTTFLVKRGRPTSSPKIRWSSVANLGFRDIPGGMQVNGVLRGNLPLDYILRFLTSIVNESEDLRID